MTGFILKLIALYTMVIDHIGVALITDAALYETFRLIGRIAFPLYVFLIAEGCRHTKNINKYFLRLFTMAVVFETAYRAFLFLIGYFYPSVIADIEMPFTNVFFTLSAGVLLVILYKSCTKLNIVISALLIAVVTWISVLIKADYSPHGPLMVLFIFLVYDIFDYFSVKNELIKKTVVALGLIVFGGLMYSEIKTVIFYSIAILFIMLYNGKEGRKMQKFFYISYPAHLIIIGLVSVIFFS